MTPRQQIKSLLVTSDPITAGLSQETNTPLDDNCIADALLQPWGVTQVATSSKDLRMIWELRKEENDTIGKV